MADSHHTITDPVEFPGGIDTSKTLFGAGIAGLVISGAGYFLDSDQFFFSYLTNFTFYTGIAVSALFLVMVHHITRSSWGTVLRRIPETLSSNLWLWGLFVIPVLFGLSALYSWSDPSYIAGDPIMEGKESYLNRPAFIVRQILYFAIWGWMGYKLHKISLEMDRTGDWGITTLMRKISAPGIVILAVTLAFASFDWLMSIEGHWFSTMFGVYFFAMSFQALFPVLILIVYWMRKRNILVNTIRKVHIYDLGAWFFAFTIFYAYIAFSQMMLIYYANLPEETVWFYARMEGSWSLVAYSLIIFRFAVPFLLLMNRDMKQRPRVLIGVSILVLFMHFIELNWIVMPVLYPQGVSFSWMDVTLLIGLGGIFLGLFFRTFRKNNMVPINDPTLPDSLGKQYHQ
ncbi:MAG: hypothetical protein WDZ29_05205 [Balneolaceae bacterium]